MSPEQYSNSFRSILEAHADPQRAADQSAYLENRFVLFGLKQSPRRNLFKQFMKEEGIPPLHSYPEFVRELYAQDEREFHYCAIELAARYTKTDGNYQQRLEVVEFLVTNHSWWDSVDACVSALIGELFLQFPEEVDPLSLKWAKSENIWLKRVSIIGQLKMREKTDLDVLFRNILLNLGSSEFFVNKAIGWALRELSKTKPEVVREFVSKNELAPLSEREAMRLILAKA